jgi:2-polyprenyl-6-methoxyphenol hydroxylase-like FAD-dependent oxidoreductase
MTTPDAAVSADVVIVGDRFRAQATYTGASPGTGFGPLRLDFSRLGPGPLHIMAIPQRKLEQVLDEWLRDLGGSVRRGHEVLALSLPGHDAPATVDVRGPDGDYRVRTRYLVGCDGARSLVRKQAGIGLRESARRVLGADLPMHDPQWLTRTVGNSRAGPGRPAPRAARGAAHVVRRAGLATAGRGRPRPGARAPRPGSPGPPPAPPGCSRPSSRRRTAGTPRRSRRTRCRTGPPRRRRTAAGPRAPPTSGRYR